MRTAPLIPERVKMTSDDEIITVADTPDFTYTANTKENVIYKAVGKSVVDDYAWNIYVDGAEQAGDSGSPPTTRTPTTPTPPRALPPRSMWMM